MSQNRIILGEVFQREVNFIVFDGWVHVLFDKPAHHEAQMLYVCQLCCLVDGNLRSLCQRLVLMKRRRLWHLWVRKKCSLLVGWRGETNVFHVLEVPQTHLLLWFDESHTFGDWLKLEKMADCHSLCQVAGHSQLWSDLVHLLHQLSNSLLLPWHVAQVKHYLDILQPLILLLLHYLDLKARLLQELKLWLHWSRLLCLLCYQLVVLLVVCVHCFLELLE